MSGVTTKLAEIKNKLHTKGIKIYCSRRKILYNVTLMRTQVSVYINYFNSIRTFLLKINV